MKALHLNSSPSQEQNHSRQKGKYLKHLTQRFLALAGCLTSMVFNIRLLHSQQGWQ